MKKLSIYLKGICATAAFLSTFNLVIAQQDMGILQITSPSSTGFINSNLAHALTFTLKNFGSTTVVSPPYSYAIDGGAPVNSSYAGTLGPGDSAQIYIGGLTFTPAIHTICVNSTLIDPNPSNDMVCINVSAKDFILLPFSEDFESGAPGLWNNGSQWEWGTPAFGSTITAHSGINAFDLDLDSAYIGGTDYLETPEFDFGQSSFPEISFWQNRDLKPGSDGLRLEYTQDQGLTWITLGTVGGAGSINWYTNPSLSTSLKPAWDGNSGGWVQSIISVSALSGYNQPVRFRFAYDGTSGGGYSGVSIDDFTILNTGFSLTISNDPIACNGDTASLYANVAGGWPPYVYLWSNGVTSQTNQGVYAGTYTVTVTDSVGTTDSVSFVLFEPPPLLCSVITTNSACGQVNGTATIIATGGNAPYYYLWSTGATINTSVISNLALGSYSIIITDVNGCDTTIYFAITNTPLPIVQHTITQNPTSCSSCDGSVTLNVSSGIPPYFYLWTNGETTQSVSNLCTGPFGCTITDASGCTAYISDYLQTSSFYVTATSTNASCGLNDGTATAAAVGGTGGYTYLWSNGAITQIITGLNAGIYSVSVYDGSGCFTQSTVVVDDSCHGVWPGDANYDLSVTNDDLLNIGLAYAATGPVRPSASLNWVAQPCPSWTTNFLSGPNYKNADCNGDGVVDDNDTTAILLNYGLAHAFKSPPVLQNLPGQPYLYLTVNSDTTGLSDTVTIDVFLGNTATPVDSIFGLAFTLNTSPLLIDTNSASVDFSNCWLGTQGMNLLTLSKNRLSEGAIDMALVRTDHQNVSGNGPIASATIVTTDNIAGKNPSALSSILHFSLSDIKGITVTEKELLFNQDTDSLVIDSTYIQGVTEIPLTQMISVNPNPSHGKFTIINSGKPANIVFTLTDMLGREIYFYNMYSNRFTFDLSAFPSGIYNLTIKSKTQVLNKKLVLTK